MPDFLNDAWLRSEGTCTMIGWPGEKPSLRFHSAGLTLAPSLLAGSSAEVSATRRPVGVRLSALVCVASFGNGSRQPRVGTPSQRAASAVDGTAMAIRIAAPTAHQSTRGMSRVPSPAEGAERYCYSSSV